MALEYHIRKATPADTNAILHHRVAMFTEMKVDVDAAALERAFVPWLRDAMTSGLYHGWCAETASAEIIGGAGVTVLPWPPAPPILASRIAYVYNVYTEPRHRRRGIALRLMETIHAWAREQGIRRIALHASDEGRPLYESMEYRATNEMQRLL